MTKNSQRVYEVRYKSYLPDSKFYDFKDAMYEACMTFDSARLRRLGDDELEDFRKKPVPKLTFRFADYQKPTQELALRFADSYQSKYGLPVDVEEIAWHIEYDSQKISGAWVSKEDGILKEEYVT